MSSYVQKVLQPGEQIRHTATLHWIIFFWGFVFIILACGLAAWIAVAALNQFWLIVPAILAAFGLVLLFKAWFRRWTTEIALTNRRVIYKTGFIRRDTKEMHADKVESVFVDQSILGRMLDYGDVTLRGTGEGWEPIQTIAAPLDLRNQITGT